MKRCIARSPLKVLVLSRNYPNNVMEQLGLWVAGLTRQIAESCEVRVISPVPYCPAALGFLEYGRFRKIKRKRWDGPILVYHPRMVVGPGYSLYRFEAAAYELGIRKLVTRIRREFQFDLIHAYFGYPDGVVAARLGQQYAVPVITTEQALWRPWMDNYPSVRRAAVKAASSYAFHIAVSSALRDSVIEFTGKRENMHVIPNGVDEECFRLLNDEARRKLNQVLYVGVLNFNKGLDVLLHAMQILVQQKPQARLILLGGFHYRNTRLQGERIQRMAHDLGLDAHVEFVGMKSPADVARYMQESALLVLPSRRESFGSVLVEALACGTPVVATRCGGPEDIVNDSVGRLVSPGNAEELADAIGSVMNHRNRYVALELRKYALDRFSWPLLANRTMDLYREALATMRVRSGSGAIGRTVSANCAEERSQLESVQ